MIHKARSALIAAFVATALALSGCGSSGPTSTDPNGASGEPVFGGTLRAIESVPPAGFDPVQLNSPSSRPITVTALYDQFLVPDPEGDGTPACGLCESFTTEDGGATWEIVTREGVTFSDGTPFDAEAVKYNWERHQDPANGSTAIGIASQIESFDVVDERTLRLVMTTPSPGFMGLLPLYAIQFIASPTALEQGTEEFNRNPIGAGPFLFESWTPGGTLRLTRNDDYFDSPRPYLDAVETQAVPDETQRLNALLAGDADVITTGEASTLAAATEAGFVENRYTFNGGVGFLLNTEKPPFDDVRARNALAYAIDLEQLSDAASRGYPSAPDTLFQEDSPFFADIPLAAYDPERAQELFDELAAEGKPLEFAYTVFAGVGGTLFDALQGQLNEYDNVTVTADQRDATGQGVLVTTGDFQAITSSLAFVDPVSRLRASLHSDGETNYSGVSDPELDAALDAALDAPDLEAQKEQYDIVQERLTELDPYILYMEFYQAIVADPEVHGAVVFGYATPSAADFWIAQ